MQPKPWRGLGVVTKLSFLFLPLVAAICVIVPFLDRGFRLSLAQSSDGTGLLNWFVNGGGNWIVLLLAAVLLAAVAILSRMKMNRDKGLWFDTGCPNCQERELVRVARQRGDRTYGWLGIRAYRYACRNCAWRGLRIGHRHHHLPATMAAEAADPLMEPTEADAVALPSMTELDLAAPAVGPSNSSAAAAAPVNAFADALDSPAPAAASATAQEVVMAPARTPQMAAVFDAAANAVTIQASSEPLESAGAGKSDGDTSAEPAEMAADEPTQRETRQPSNSPAPALLSDEERAESFSEDELEWLWRRLSEGK